MRWKRWAHGELPSLQHYVVVAPDEVGLRCYDRAMHWQERQLGALEDRLNLRQLRSA